MSMGAENRLHSKPPRRRQKDRNAETRLKLLNSAALTIYELGYARASIGVIVNRAGVTKGAHLHHFQTKEQLMRATIEHLFAEVRSNQEHVARTVPLLPNGLADRDAIERYLQATAAAAFDWQFVSLLEIWMASRTDAALHEAFSDFEARFAALRIQGLRNAVGEEVVHATDLGRIIGGFNFMLRGLFLQQILGGDWRRNKTWLFWRGQIAEQIKDAMTRRRDGTQPRRTAANR